MKATWNDGLGLIAQAFNACDEKASVERAMLVVMVETYTNGEELFFGFHKGDRRLVDKAVLEIAKRITAK